MTNIAKPQCQTTYSHAVVCGPPMRPSAVNTPGKARMYGSTVSVVNRYPLAITRMARERRMEN